jgi:hypothetical protein
MHFLRSLSAFLQAGLFCTILLLALSGVSSGAAAALKVRVEGLEEEARKNVELALAPPRDPE